jgi:hypothetical protein
VRQIKDVFSEYTRMRANGLDAKSALNVLRPHIETLNKTSREELATMLRAWESTHGSAAPVNPPPPAQPSYAAPQPPPPPPQRAPQPIQRPPAPPPQPLRPVQQPAYEAPEPNWPARPATPTPPTPGPGSSNIRPLNRPQPAPPPAAPARPQESDPQIVWVGCPNCGKANQQHEVFCYFCGQLLEPTQGRNDTRVFADASNSLDSEYFGMDSVLVLRVRGTADTIELRPQKSDHEMIVGRGVRGSAVAPDIDLEDRRGADLGVSRLHMSIRYDTDNNVIMVADLGSANGTYINGQRLVAKEQRVIRHGDEVRVGRLVINISFRHPGKPVNPA